VPAWRARIPERDELHVSRLRAAGAIVLGKTNVAQCLLFLETDNPLYGRTNHPADATRSPGGSSGGEAAIIGSHGSPLGLGTDIGGSGRVPAAFCGIFGLKPSTGRMPDLGRGSTPIGQRAITSQVSVFARSVDDIALALEVAADRDQTPVLRDHRAVDVRELRVGYFVDDGVFAPAAACTRAVAEAKDRLAQRGATLVPIDPPDLRQAYGLFYSLMSADRAAGLSRILGKGPRVPQLKQIEQVAQAPAILLPLIKSALRLSGRRKAVDDLVHFGPYSADAFWQACERQLEYQARWRELMREQRLSAVLSPATALPALKHGATVEVGIMGSYTCSYNVLGWPAGVVPITRVRPDEETLTPRGSDVRDRTARATEEGSAGLPIAVQIAAAPFREDRVLALMRALQP
jgi:fatty acid amide hydrolase